MRRTQFIMVQDRTQCHIFQSFLASSSSGVFIKGHQGWRIGWRTDIERAVKDDRFRSVVTRCPPLFAQIHLGGVRLVSAGGNSGTTAEVAEIGLLAAIPTAPPSCAATRCTQRGSRPARYLTSLKSPYLAM
jgi:hypothetical protein